MQNRDKLYRLYAKIPGSLYHVLFHGYTYVDEKTQEPQRGALKNVDIAIYGFLYLNSDMRDTTRGGTGLTQWFSAKMVSDASRPTVGEKPAWSIGTVQQSLRRLRQAGFLLDKVAPTAKRRVKLFDPGYLPSRQRNFEEESKIHEASLGSAKSEEDDE